MAAAARVPITVGHGTNAVVILRQAQERGVNGLFFRTDQAHLDFAIAEGEHLGPEHRGVGDAHQLELALPTRLRAMMKNHGPSGEPWMCAAWMAR